jgi:hypothetical protein
MFAALCSRAHPLKHSLAESIFVSRVQKAAKKSLLAEKFISKVTRWPRYHCNVSLFFSIQNVTLVKWLNVPNAEMANLMFG